MSSSSPASFCPGMSLNLVLKAVSFLLRKYFIPLTYKNVVSCKSCKSSSSSLSTVRKCQAWTWNAKHCNWRSTPDDGLGCAGFCRSSDRFPGIGICFPQTGYLVQRLHSCRQSLRDHRPLPWHRHHLHCRKIPGHAKRGHRVQGRLVSLSCPNGSGGIARIEVA